ncbi:GDSL-like Lipase/Acylhydrolase [Allorhodopirellula heiligendammensis]|uniref:GDSL-like Lipase/Acylhydrolase n=2 Tax=Allorhodopirellula heiligendammensis TaxID=2714739 RepID=A0A5C6BW45_9BACT|nr:GDSL-like Lipase/Acylhydrolase [Allorhodopirellula heiligendammensis]
MPLAIQSTASGYTQISAFFPNRRFFRQLKDCTMVHTLTMTLTFSLAFAISPLLRADQGSAAQSNAGAQAETKTGEWATTPDPDLPNVLILGDSISIGYTLQVRDALTGKANVYRPHSPDGRRPENCSGTTKGVADIGRWLKGPQWDVIHFNFGLHDLKHVREADASQASNSMDDPRQAEPETYRKNLTEIVEKLKATDAKLIYATTTGYPAGVSPARLPADAKVYNEIAIEIMNANEIEINDLYALCQDRLDELQLNKNVHFNAKGKAVQAKRVARVIARGLESREPAAPNASK